jgi:hypothetical protein
MVGKFTCTCRVICLFNTLKLVVWHIIHMRLLTIVTIAIAGTLAIFSCSRNEVERGESLAKKYCGTCHLFPEPKLLDKKTWADGVMPRMAFHLGIDFAPMVDLVPVERSVVMATIPDSPMITEEEWRLIKLYYAVKAPDSLIRTEQPTDSLIQFNPEHWHQPGKAIPQLTFARFNENNGQFFLADRMANLFIANNNLQLKDSLSLRSPASDIIIGQDTTFILTMGIMDPNDQAKGAIIQHTAQDTFLNLTIDSLRRPVNMERADLNADGLLDFVVCEFGNYTGGLTAFQNLGNGQYKRRTISKHSGARKVMIRDFNGDGKPDILALITQGNEQLSLFTNVGNFNFRITSLLRFPPVYGSSYFELADVNNDGKDDIIYSNGDNADYSGILKPYHGLRIYLYKGVNAYEESLFYPMDGAAQTIAKDFDGDGDTDIAAIAFFPDFKRHPERGFIYLENKGQMKFKSYATPLAASARWMTMSSGDLDKDGDEDIILAALNFDKSVTNQLSIRWKEQPTSLLILRNTYKAH